MRILRKVTVGYNHLLTHHPRKLVGTQNGILLAVGDFWAQTCVEKVPLDEVESVPIWLGLVLKHGEHSTS